jgi:hypothetical protein
VSECDHEYSIMGRPWPTGDCCSMEKILYENMMAFLSKKYTEKVTYYLKSKVFSTL